MCAHAAPRPNRLLALLALLALITSASAQPPKAPAPNADEQKALEAFKAGKFDDALKSLQAAAKTNPALGLPKVVLSQWFLQAGGGEQARLVLEQAAAENPNHPHVLLANGSYALREGRVTDTILSCSAALAATADPGLDAESKKRYSREARMGLVKAYELRGNQVEVRTHLTALLDADPRNAALRQSLARTHFVLGRPDDAHADLKLAFKDDMTLDPPELTMAELWTGKRDFAKADEWYGKAVAAHGNSAKVHRGFASYSLDRGRPDTAKVHLAAAEKIEPNARETRAIAGLLARYAKDYPRATAIFEELVRDHPSFAFATVNLALVLAESGDANGKRRAAELADGFVKQNPRDSEARAVLGYCLLKADRAADAEAAAKVALGMGVRSPDAAYFVAKILADRGTAEDAHKVAKAACESKDGFVYRKEAEAMVAELEKKLPPPKK